MTQADLRPCPRTAIHKGARVTVPKPPETPITTFRAYVDGLQFLLAVDYLRDRRRPRLLAHVTEVERAIIQFLLSQRKAESDAAHSSVRKDLPCQTDAP